MTIAQEIFDCLDALAAPALAMDWDNSGLQIGSRSKPVQKVLVATVYCLPPVTKTAFISHFTYFNRVVSL